MQKKNKQSSNLRLTVQYTDNKGEPPSPRTVRRYLKVALNSPAEVTVRFVSQQEARELNWRYRKRHYTPDVLAFSTADAYDHKITGDIAACPVTIESKANAGKIPIRKHYARMLIHSALHLSGHTHENDDDSKEMEQAEDEALAKLGFNNR